MFGSSVFAILGGLFYLVLHLSDGNRFPPPLSSEEERTYFRRARAGDSKAREKLIEHNLRLVAHIVRKYYSQNKNQEDLSSIGSIGLIKAIDTFNISNGARFTTYAGKCIQNEILMYFRTQKKTGAEISINETIDVDKDGNPLTYEDVLCTEDHIAEELFTKISSARAVEFIMKELEDRERYQTVYSRELGSAAAPTAGLHFTNELLEVPLTQREIAKEMGISRSYVSRIEKGALQKIAEYLRLCV